MYNIGIVYIHKSIIDSNNKDRTGRAVLDLGMVHEAGDMGAGAGGAEGSRDTDDDALLVGELSSEIDLVAGRRLMEGHRGDGSAGEIRSSSHCGRR